MSFIEATAWWSLPLFGDCVVEKLQVGFTDRRTQNKSPDSQTIARVWFTIQSLRRNGVELTRSSLIRIPNELVDIANDPCGNILAPPTFFFASLKECTPTIGAKMSIFRVICQNGSELVDLKGTIKTVFSRHNVDEKGNTISVRL